MYLGKASVIQKQFFVLALHLPFVIFAFRKEKETHE